MNLITKNPTKNLYKAILSLKNENECKKFLRDLLTEAEIKEFSNRWKVAQLLDQKTPYGKIEKQTGMSSTTIARISKWLNNGENGYRLVLNKLKNNQTHTHLTR
jgi:TrpR-related protein YerC/YecD